MNADDRVALGWIVLLGASIALLPGCVTVDPGAPQTLQTAMAANHQATIAVLQMANADAAPFLVHLGLSKDSFSKADLYLIDPGDIAAWDKIMGGLDAYCAALSALASGKSSSDFVTATEGLAGSVQALGKSVKSDTQPYTAAGGTALAEIGSLLLQHKADVDLQRVAQAADPNFQLIIKTLLVALGFEGSPPKPATHGLWITYSDVFKAATAARQKAFQNDEIIGFAHMSAEEKGAKIHALEDWLSTKQEDARLADSMTALAIALDKAARAHAVLATGSKEDVAKEFAALKTQVSNAVAIYQTLNKK